MPKVHTIKILMKLDFSLDQTLCLTIIAGGSGTLKQIYLPRVTALAAVCGYTRHSPHARASPRSFVWGDGCKGTQTHLPPIFSFSSDFGHFILKMEENAEFSYV